MTVMVTGAGGFVGRALVRALLDSGRSVVAMDTHLGGLPAHERLRAVAGDICAAEIRHEALRDGVTALVHLATVPGGAAEADPSSSRRVNIDAMYDLLQEARDAGSRPRIVYASSIAIFGDPLPAAGVDDSTPIAPKMVYGGHKAMMEIAVAMMSHRREIDGVTVRLPGILARPKGRSGMKSAFMSDLFHALRAGEPFVCPVSEAGTIWAESIAQCVRNLMHALSLDSGLLPATRAVTLPALRPTMGELAGEIARQCGVPPTLVRYAPDAGLEAAFAAQPPLATPAAERAGFRHDGSLAGLVENALRHIVEG